MSLNGVENYRAFVVQPKIQDDKFKKAKLTVLEPPVIYSFDWIEKFFKELEVFPEGTQVFRVSPIHLQIVLLNGLIFNLVGENDDSFSIMSQMFHVNGSPFFQYKDHDKYRAVFFDPGLEIEDLEIEINLPIKFEKILEIFFSYSASFVSNGIGSLAEV